jgi:hypothetical protein
MLRKNEIRDDLWLKKTNLNKQTDKESIILNFKKIKETEELYEAFEQEKNNVSGKPSYLTNYHLDKVIEIYCPESTELWQKVRNFEQGVRNIAAHEIVGFDRERAKRDGGHDPQEILQIMAKMSRTDLNLYQRICDETLREIDSNNPNPKS